MLRISGLDEEPSASKVRSAPWS